MRSWRELVLCALLAACGTEFVEDPTIGGEDDGGGEPIVVEVDACETSYLEYDNFGAPFVSSWCRGCHSSQLPEGMRQKAPMAVNFDTLAEVRQFSGRIAARAASTTATMPPAGGPTLEERTLLAEWIACGVR